ncbi:hypothetical protein GLYMA_11G254400v4 [Glycine max]|nr:hypothetical protein GLYMA_11G254400v4 [Glycine max]
MAAANSEGNGQKPRLETFQLFSSSASAFGIFDDAAQQVPHIPPPPCVEVLASEGRVNTQQVFGLSNSNLVPWKYEGGLKLWEGSLDLIKALRSDIRNGLISFSGKRVLEVGSGHGLPGIFALLEGAAAVHFQDFNAEKFAFLLVTGVELINCSLMSVQMQKIIKVMVMTLFLWLRQFTQSTVSKISMILSRSACNILMELCTWQQRSIILE